MSASCFLNTVSLLKGHESHQRNGRDPDVSQENDKIDGSTSWYQEVTKHSENEVAMPKRCSESSKRPPAAKSRGDVSLRISEDSKRL